MAWASRFWAWRWRRWPPAAVGFVTGSIILRTHGLTLLMLTLVVATMLYELANKANSVTGGADGLQGMAVKPVFGLFRFDLYGRTAYLYCLGVLFIGWLVVRRIVHSPFGRSLTGIRENEARMHAIGTPVLRRRLTAYTISAALGGDIRRAWWRRRRSSSGSTC